MTHSRRQFLSEAALASATLAVLGSTPLTTWAARPVAKTGALDRLRVAVIGLNSRGRDLIKGFGALPDCEIAVLCDVDPKLEGNTRKLVETVQPGTPTFVTDLRRVMDDQSIDLVGIATPNHWHSLAAIWAVQAGKDVYVEKPVSHTVVEGRRLVQLARKHDRIVQVGTQSRSNPGMRQLIEFLQAGKIGEIKTARGLCYKPRASIGPKVEGKVPADLDYDLWCGPAAKLPITRARFHYDWHWTWEYGNGDLGNQGVHEMDKAMWGLGCTTLPTRVLSLGGRLGYVDAGETPNTLVSFFDYGPRQIIFEVRGLRTEPLRGAKVGNIWYGTEGVVVSTSYDSGAAFTLAGEPIQQFRGGASHFANFVKAVRSRQWTDLHADVEVGHLSAALCHLGNISLRTGRAVSEGERDKLQQGELLALDAERTETLSRLVDHCRANDAALDGLFLGAQLDVDPEREVIRDNPAANDLLSREHRKGFELPSVTSAGPVGAAPR